MQNTTNFLLNTNMEAGKVERQSTSLFSRLGKSKLLPLQDTRQPSLTVMQKLVTTESYLQ
eukprot:11245849-Ditylum_brightwellii.AAC.1